MIADARVVRIPLLVVDQCHRPKRDAQAAEHLRRRYSDNEKGRHVIRVPADEFQLPTNTVPLGGTNAARKQVKQPLALIQPGCTRAPSLFTGFGPDVGILF